jgi:hypothetical protein
MRLIATILDIALIGAVIYLLSDMKSPDGRDLIFAVLFLAAPLASLLALRVPHGEDWMSLYIRRKALEEKKKIEHLNSKEVP